MSTPGAEQDRRVTVVPDVADDHPVDDPDVAVAGELDVVDVLQQQVAARLGPGDVLGLPLAAVEALLPCALDDRPAFGPCPELRAMLRARLDRLDAAAQDLARSREEVAAALGRADAGEVLAVGAVRTG
ncbi:MAG TPA: MerR family DNA-binding protein [Acidimicrobiales bacterium]|nr:MerR family DNA-binding protein [Acidimicrobiales bacterium]